MDRDPIEILRAANPVTHDTPIDVDALIARVYARTQHSRRRAHVVASFKVRIAASLTLAAAAGAAVILTLSSLTPSLIPLSLAKSGSSPAHGATPSMMFCQLCNISPYTFVGSGLSTDSASAPVYTLTAPNPTDASGVLVDYLALANVTTTTPYEGVVEITAGTTTIDVAGNNLGSLYITDTNGLALPELSSDEPVALEAAVQNLIAATDPGYQLTDPQVSVTQPDPANSVSGDEFVSYSVSIDGHVITDLEVSADFNTQGALLSLTAPLFSVASDANYPLVSPQAGVSTINTEAAEFRSEQVSQNATTPPTSPVTVPAGTSAGSPGADTTTVSPPLTTPVEPSTVPDVTTTTQPSVVTLTSDTLSWYLSALSNGQVAAIPVYAYSGTYPDGTSADLAWRVPALDPASVAIPSDWTPFWFWAWGHVVPMMLQNTVPSPATASTPTSPPTLTKP